MVFSWRHLLITPAVLAITLGSPALLPAQRTATITEDEARSVAIAYDSLLALGDPVGIDDLLAPEFTREIITDGQDRSVVQSRHAFLASITGSLGETDVTLERKRGPIVVHIRPVTNEAEVEYTVTEQVVTAEGTGFVSTIESRLKLGIRGEEIQILTLENRNRFKSRD